MSSPWSIVTGASSGIGRATALSLAAEGYHLMLLGRRRDRLNELAQEIQKKFPKVECQVSVVDVTDPSQVEKFFQNQAALMDHVEILVNNAGLAKGADPLQRGSIEDWDLMIDTNVKGLLYFTRGVLPSMTKRKSGHIINIGSVAGRWVYPGGAVYCASKHAVKAISEGLRMDLLGLNIRVTNIEPGMVNTEFSKVRFNDPVKADKVYENMNPLTAEDIAECIVWCLKRPAHVNIQELVVYPTDQAHVNQVHRR